ncbi:Ig-like domain-containing protein [Colwellia sp. 4_MG-2023]|uniref:Ig-like domain-containing protein n=1 Tax=unclassified Colwellia TaxID=196834 RepID=UPI0026E1A65B|nr:MULTISPECIES: Ig-like domain-containing protein [unclassified Colwellia]MDO6506611.1 Ig-like domain-containing protein [Colwellia sp. 5_MG-2023]MDO6555098.1 Ig-like domain-containing protein [Colwellia sp. 4_MG-2023]
MKKLLTIMIMFTVGFTHAESYISLKSDQGEFIGSGQEHELTGDFSVSIGESQISINHSSGFNFLFIPPIDRDLERGVYLSAERAPFRGPLNPRMSVGSSGRVCNTIAGEFYIYELDYSGDTQILAMDFIQYCDSNSVKLTGSIRINSDIQTPYPLPFPIISSNSTSVLEGNSFVITGEKSVSKASKIESYYWEQVSGPKINIASVVNESTEVEVLNGIELGGEEIVLKLTVNNNLGQSESIKHTINAKSKSDPRTYFTMDSEAGDYIGADQDWFYDLSTSSITMSKNYDNGISVSISGSEHWSAEFAAPDEVQLQVGEYDYAERFPFQDAGAAGLTISGNGRGCNRNYGRFNVTKLVWENDQPKAFKASFEQHCEQMSAPLLSGEVAVNAVHDSVPYANAGVDIEINEHEVVNLNGSDSFDPLGNIVIYKWSTANETVTINNHGESRANFIAPSLPDKAESNDVQVSLLVTDDEGYKAIDSVNVRVLANNSSPVSVDDYFEVLIGGIVQLTPLNNDDDSDGQIIIDSIEVIQEPAHGTLIINSQGIIEYSHTGSSTTEDTITYSVKDNDGAISNEATIKIQIKEQINVPEPEAKQSSGGGTMNFWLILFIFVSFGYRLKANRMLS